MSRALQDEVGTVLDDRTYCLALEPSAGRLFLTSTLVSAIALVETVTPLFSSQLYRARSGIRLHVLALIWDYYTDRTNSCNCNVV